MENTDCLQVHILDDVKEHKHITDLVEKLKLENSEQTTMMKEIHTAIFGDKNGNQGMKANNDEMYKVFTASDWAMRMVLKGFGAIAVITSSIIGIIELMKRLK